MTLAQTIPKTWPDLVALRPALRRLDRLLARMKPIVRAGNQWELYEQAKRELSLHVGYLAPADSPPELLTAEAYDIGLAHILQQLGI